MFGNMQHRVGKHNKFHQKESAIENIRRNIILSIFKDMIKIDQ